MEKRQCRAIRDGEQCVQKETHSGKHISLNFEWSRPPFNTRLINIIGQKFGRWTVLEHVPNSVKKGATLFRCECECGTIKILEGRAVRKGRTQSCGCLVKLPDEGGAKHNLLLSYKFGAKNRNIEWNISDELFHQLTAQNCYYCGAPPSDRPKWRGGKYKGFFKINGIDRIDSSKEYTAENVVPCCTTCNRMKLALSSEEFTNHIRKIYEHFMERIPAR